MAAFLEAIFFSRLLSMRLCVLVVDCCFGLGVGMKSRKVFLRGLDKACGEGGEGICFFWAGVLGRDTGHSSGSGRDFLLS